MTSRLGRNLLLLSGLIVAGVAPLTAAVITAHRDADGVTFALPDAVLRLQVWSDRIIRVTYAPGDALPETTSLCVIAQPAAVKWDFRETPAEFIVATGAVQARVDRQGIFDGVMCELLTEYGPRHGGDGPAGAAG